MKLTDLRGPIDVMLSCCLPDRRNITAALRTLSPGETLQVKIENSYAVKHMIEKILNNQWFRIIETEDAGDFSIVTIKKEA